MCSMIQHLIPLQIKKLLVRLTLERVGIRKGTGRSFGIAVGEELFGFMKLRKRIQISVLTPCGRRILRESGFFVFYDSIKRDAMGVLEASGVDTFSDLESTAYAFLRSVRDDVRMCGVRQYVFSCQYSIDSVLRAGAIVIRDEYFKQCGIGYG
jgi:hypothetical protein